MSRFRSDRASLYPRLRLLASGLTLAAIGVGVLAANDAAFSLLERAFGLQFANLPLMIYATLPPRAVLACCFMLALSLTVAISLRLPTRWRFPFVAVVGVLGTVAAFLLIGGSLRLCGLLAVLFVANIAPKSLLERWMDHPVWSRVFDVVFGLGVVVTEVLFPRPFWVWLWRNRNRAGQPARERLIAYVPAIAMAGALMSIAPSYSKLAGLGWLMTQAPGVDRFYGKGFSLYSPYDTAAMALDTATERLFLCGDGLETVKVVSLRNLDVAPIDTRIPIAGAQFCTIDLDRREILVVNFKRDALIVADLDSYAIRKAIGPLRLPAGETFVSKQRGSPLVLAASEDVSRDPSRPRILLIDLDSGRIVAQSRVRAGYMLVDPVRPKAYVSSYSDGFGLLDLQLPTLEQQARRAGDPRLDRIAVDTRRGQVLVASPLHSRVLVFDANSLAPRGEIRTEFGTRSMAVDERRDLLLTASLVTTRVDLIDLKTRRRVAQFKLGPWLRDVVVDPGCGRAFVSSRHGVYVVQYAKPEPEPGRACR